MDELSRKQKDAIRALTLIGPQAHDPSFFNGTLRGASKTPFGRLGQQGTMGGSSEALNPGMSLNVETGKQTAMKKGGAVKKAKPKCMARGGGCEVRGKTKGRFV